MLLNYLYFLEDELGTKDTGHSKPLYITDKCKDYIVTKVPINKGSSFNVMPVHILDRLLVSASHMRPNNIMEKAYGCSLR
jgi:hypothetical protein